MGDFENLNETRRYWKLKDEAQDRIVWRTQFGRGCGSVGNTDCGMNYISCAVQITKLLFVQFFQPPATSSLLGPNIFLSTLFFEHPQPMPLPQFEIPSFTPVQKTTGEFTVLYILTFIFWLAKRKTHLERSLLPINRHGRRINHGSLT